MKRQQDKKKIGRQFKKKHGFNRGSTEYNKISNAVSNSIVRFLSKNKHMTQKHMAILIGVNRMSITYYIKGSRIPDVITFLRMIAVGLDFNINVGEFFIHEKMGEQKK